MKNNQKEVVIVLVQLLLFYVLPLTVSDDLVVWVVLLTVVATFVLSLVLGIVSKNKLKYFYPLFVSVLFIPTIFIYYDDSFYVYIFWHLLESCIGLAIGSLLKSLIIMKGRD